MWRKIHPLSGRISRRDSPLVGAFRRRPEKGRENRKQGAVRMTCEDDFPPEGCDVTKQRWSSSALCCPSVISKPVVMSWRRWGCNLERSHGRRIFFQKHHNQIVKYVFLINNFVKKKNNVKLRNINAHDHPLNTYTTASQPQNHQEPPAKPCFVLLLHLKKVEHRNQAQELHNVF